MPVVAITAIPPLAEPGWATAIASLVLGGTTIALLIRGRRGLQGTTLVAPWFWAVVTVITISSCELLLGTFGRVGFHSGGSVGAARFVCYATAFCPLMALLGARRPHEKAWQFIVLSLWGILILPAVAVLFLGRSTFDLHAVRSWFLVLLIAVGIVNGLPTRYWIAWLLFAAGQVVLFGEQLPFARDYLTGNAEHRPPLGAAGPLLGLGLFMMAILSVYVVRAAQARRQTGKSTAPYDRLWLDFRDCFGAIWALRVVERINAAAQTGGWPLCLRWNGFSQRQDHDAATREKRGDLFSDLSKPQQEVYDQAIRNLLRRFVSPDWIDRRLIK